MSSFSHSSPLLTKPQRMEGARSYPWPWDCYWLCRYIFASYTWKLSKLMVWIYCGHFCHFQIWNQLLWPTKQFESWLDIDSEISPWRFPWWRSGWESACQCRGHGFEPWSGKIPYATEQLGPWATTTEPARLEPVLCNKRGRRSERPAHRDEEWPPLATTRESPRTETKTQHSQK